jgi:hypothetical protein
VGDEHRDRRAAHDAFRDVAAQDARDTAAAARANHHEIGAVLGDARQQSIDDLALARATCGAPSMLTPNCSRCPATW